MKENILRQGEGGESEILKWKENQHSRMSSAGIFFISPSRQAEVLLLTSCSTSDKKSKDKMAVWGFQDSKLAVGHVMQVLDCGKARK